MDGVKDEHAMRAAARWKARLLAADCTAAEREAFEAWRRVDVAHADAFAAAERITDAVDALHLVDPRFQALVDDALHEHRAKRSARHRWVLPAAAAAGLAGLMLALRFLPDIGSAAEPVVYHADIDTPRVVRLEDGSIVNLDAGSRVQVVMTQDRRDIRLLAGRAVFDVEHDRTRPFTVNAAGFDTTALGTRFQVDLQEKDVVVTLAEGRVAVDGERPEHALNERLEPGEQLRIDRVTTEHSKSFVDTHVATSWSEGRLAFRSTPLRVALDEVNRYSHKKVRLGDPTLAAMPVAGNFIAGDSESVVTALTALLPLRVVVSGEDEVILFRRYSED
jgi:transmembrane sensor